MIDISVDVEKTRAALRKLAATVRDTTVPNRQAGTELYKWTMKNFNSQGSLLPQPWAPLAASTVKRKAKLGKSVMLVISGNLRQSFAPFADKEQAGVGARASFEYRKKERAIGDYARYIQEGTSRMPARPMLPPVKDATDMAYRVYDLYVSKGKQEAGL